MTHEKILIAAYDTADDHLAAIVESSRATRGRGPSLTAIIANGNPDRSAHEALTTHIELGYQPLVGYGTASVDEDPRPPQTRYKPPAGRPFALHSKLPTGSLVLARENEPESIDVPPGRDVFPHMLQQMPGRQSIDLVTTSRLTDAYELWDHNRTAFMNKIRSVTIMGGVQTVGGEVVLDDQGQMMPDASTNMSADAHAAHRFFADMQDNGVPMTIVTRHAAMAVALRLDFFTAIATSGHPTGERAFTALRQGMNRLWAQCCMNKDDPHRTLPWGDDAEPRDPQWFSRTFCNGEDLTGTALPPWMHVRQVPPHNTLTRLAAADDFRTYYLDPLEVEVHGVKHQIIGASADQHGIRDQESAREYITASARYRLGLPVTYEQCRSL